MAKVGEMAETTTDARYDIQLVVDPQTPHTYSTMTSLNVLSQLLPSSDNISENDSGIVQDVADLMEQDNSDNDDSSSNTTVSTDDDDDVEKEKFVDESKLCFFKTANLEDVFKIKYNHENENVKIYRSNFGQICCFRRADPIAILSKGIQAQYNSGGKFDLHDYSAVLIQNTYIPREWELNNKSYQMASFFKETFISKEIPMIINTLYRRTDDIYQIKSETEFLINSLIAEDTVSESWFEHQLAEFERILGNMINIENDGILHKLINARNGAEKLDMYSTWNLRKNQFDNFNTCNKYLWNFYVMCMSQIKSKKYQLKNFTLDNYGGGVLEKICQKSDSNLLQKMSSIFSINSFLSYSSLQIKTFTIIDYLHTGHSKLWLIVPPKENAKLAKAFYEEYYHQQQQQHEKMCSMPLKHSIFVVTPNFFKKHEIEVELFVQHPGTMVIIKDQVYHQSINLGVNFSEQIHYGTNLRLIADKFIDYCTCGMDFSDFTMIKPLSYKIVLNKKKKRVFCKYCKKTLDVIKDGISLKDHIKQNHLDEKERKFKCQYCSFKFLNLSTKIQHEHNHVLREGQCYICKPPQHYVRLQKHIKEQHNISILNKYIGNALFKEKFRINFEHLDPYTTDQSSTEAILENIYAELNAESFYCNPQVINEELVPPSSPPSTSLLLSSSLPPPPPPPPSSQEDHNDDDLSCKKCLKIFKKRNFLKKHSLSCRVSQSSASEQQKTVKCTICQKYVKFVAKEKHEQKCMGISCKYCQKMYMNEKTCNRHMLTCKKNKQ